MTKKILSNCSICSFNKKSNILFFPITPSCRIPGRPEVPCLFPLFPLPAALASLLLRQNSTMATMTAKASPQRRTTKMPPMLTMPRAFAMARWSTVFLAWQASEEEEEDWTSVMAVGMWWRPWFFHHLS